MVERHILVLVFASLAIVGTMALALWLTWEDPQIVPIGQLGQVELGTRVTVEGTVSDQRVSSDVTVLVLSDGTGDQVEAFCRFPFNGVSSGTRVRATGQVSLYRGDLELVVDEREDLVLLGSVRSPLVGVEDLAREPWAYEGMEPWVAVVVLTGPVADLNGEDWWCLVGDHTSGGAGVLTLVGPGHGVEAWGAGNELELRVAVRYDGSSGFVYLEVLDVS